MVYCFLPYLEYDIFAEKQKNIKLHPHLGKLCKWVLGGFGMACKSQIQCANFLVVYNPCDEYFAIHSVDDYTKLLLERRPLAFGTPFAWTYASKQRGKSIQLKVPIIRD